MKHISKKLFSVLTSIKLAVIVILALAVLSAIGTIYEARYDAEYAQKLIYQSPYMYGVMIVLSLTLIAVMVDRWPWKKRHAAFVLAHIGIIITLIGAVFTQKMGVDGSMAFRIGETKNRVTIKDRDLAVYGSFGDGEVRPLLQKQVEFVTHPPTEKDPYVLPFGSEKIEFVEYQHLAFREEKIIASDREADGPAVRFQLTNPNVNMTEWIRRESGKSSEVVNLGPASVVLSDGSYQPQEGVNEVILVPVPKTDEIRYMVYDKSNLLKTRGKVKESQEFDVGWMGLKLKVLRYHPKSYKQVTYQKAEGSSPLAHSALRFRFRGQEYWIGIGSLIRLYTEDSMYVLAYVFRQIDVGFPLILKDFQIGHYQGTKRAASYQSLVETPDGKEVVISMNEPLKYGGFTFYQSSFEQDEMGKPKVSVLSVNHDPGRWLKYFGSFLIVLGSILLFYFKKALARPRKT
ncbi:MAG TPA: cytochrome c biogenesis protein [Bdellovibrionales bacterium]|nr:cytochrome c biogenesis protein [Pseudobdellovibrionaceae bacterium]HAG90668.1 cytochrome c biogenesis protein [Bdellovibrionales bacterium]